MTQIGDVKRCAFCAYEGEEPGFGEHVRAAHGFIPQADAPPPPGEIYGIRAPTGPQLLAIGFVLLFVFGAVWVIEGYGFTWMPFGGGLDPLQMLGLLCLPAGVFCLLVALERSFAALIQRWTGSGSASPEDPSSEPPS